MMSGSSHAADRQLLDVMRDKGVPAGEVVTASVLVEPPQREAASRSRRSSSCTQTDEEAIRPATALITETPPPARREDGGGDSADRPDGALKTGLPATKQEPPLEEEESCGIKCLYYTMQCCECAVM